MDTVSSPSPAAGQLAAVSAAAAAATAATTAAATAAAAAATTACLGKQRERKKPPPIWRSAVFDYNRGLQRFTRAGLYKLPEA